MTGMKRAFFAIVSCLLAALPSMAQTNGFTHAPVWIVPPFVRDLNQVKQQQFLAFNPHYLEQKTNFLRRFRPVAKQIFAREAAGADVQCAHQIYEELLWLVTSSADVKRMDDRLRDLEAVLASSTSNRVKTVAGPECMTEWFQHLDWAYDHVKSNEPIPPEILDRINSPEKLTAYLTPLTISDMARTGRNNTWEYNQAMAALIRWIVRDRPDDQAFHPRLKATMLELVVRFQDPETGCWGQRYVIDGKERFVPELSPTFHIVSYLKGEVPHLDRTMAVVLATKDMDTPIGWQYKGQVYNHNYTDVIELFKWGWPHANAEQRKAIAAGIQEMLHRCLTESLQPDGSFKHLEADASIEQATYFGVEFLARAGFFDKSKRFWTDQDFPEAEAIRQRIIAYIKSQTAGAGGGSWYRDALNSLKTEG